MQTAKCRQTTCQPQIWIVSVTHSISVQIKGQYIWHPSVNEPMRAFWRRRRFSTSRPSQQMVTSGVPTRLELWPHWYSIVEMWNIEWSAVDIKWLHVRVWPHVPWILAMNYLATAVVMFLFGFYYYLYTTAGCIPMILEFSYLPWCWGQWARCCQHFFCFVTFMWKLTPLWRSWKKILFWLNKIWEDQTITRLKLQVGAVGGHLVFLLLHLMTQWMTTIII